jgi:hypothetical protein
MEADDIVRKMRRLRKMRNLRIVMSDCGFHDQGDAKWIVIRRQLRGHNDTPFGRPTSGLPIGCLGVGRPQGVFDGFSYH